jgi:hypothetical protein
MLFTDVNWAESSTFRRAIAKPYRPWRCVGWTDDSICFWVFPARASNRAGTLPDGLLVVDPETLRDVVEQISPDAFSVYVMDANVDGQPRAQMRRLTGLWWSQPRIDPTARDYWYKTEEGQFRPCSRLQGSDPDDVPLQLVLRFDVPDDGRPGIVTG